MRWLLAAACLVAGCQKGPAHDGPAENTLSAAAMHLYPSYDAFCAALKGGVCLGEWAGHAGGQSALGAYRFVSVEYANVKDGQGPKREVHIELTTPGGVAYRLLGQTREGAVTDSVIVKEVIDRADALELKLVFRISPRLIYTDYYSSIFLTSGPRGPAAVEVGLGKIVGDINTGKTTGGVGNASWKSGKVLVKGAALADGEWTVAVNER